MPILRDDNDLHTLLKQTRRIAVVGLSDDPSRPSYRVAAYLQAQGYEIFPVNPRLVGSQVLGNVVYPSLAALPITPDLVDVFRRSAFVSEVVEDALAAQVGALWTQLGVRDDVALQCASDAGMRVVINRYTLVEHGRLGVGKISETSRTENEG